MKKTMENITSFTAQPGCTSFAGLQQTVHWALITTKDCGTYEGEGAVDFKEFSMNSL